MKINRKKKPIAFHKNHMTVNQKLNKILKFIVDQPDRINVDSTFIRKEIFQESITEAEAHELFRKLYVSGTVRVLGYRYLNYTTGTKIYLDGGGFGGEHTNNTTIKMQTSSVNPEKELQIMKVFVTYSWGDPEHEKKVREFTNELREKGIHAEMDVMLSQKETAINFTKMMHLAMQYPKVIVVLSENYKSRADTFAGGVGKEYTMLINDISNNPNKYILVSFNGRSEDIIPFGLKGNDIVDLSLPDGTETLFRKLTGQHKYIFSEVASTIPKFEPETIHSFQAIDPKTIISIEEPTVKLINANAFGGLYKWIDFDMQLYFKNTSGKSLEGFAYDVKLKRELMPEQYDQPAKDGYLILSENSAEKMFPSRTVKGKTYRLKISSHLARQVIGTKITVTVYTDHGEHSREFIVKELFKVRPFGTNYGEAEPLNESMFG